MKKLIAVLLTCLLVGAMLSCAVAEEVYADAVDPVTIEQQGEAALEQDEAVDPGEGYADFVYEGEAEFYVPEEAPMASPASDFVIENGVLKEYVGKGGDVVIPSGVTSIGNSAFSKNNEEGERPVTSVVIPEGVTSIGDYAFSENVPSLKHITFPSTLVSIGYDAFWSCEKLENFTLPSSLRTIGSGAFMFCDSLTSVTIPEGVTTIEGSAFFECKNLAEVTVAASVKELKWNEFAQCPSLKRVVLQDGFTTLGEEAFRDCDKLESIVIPASVTSIDKRALSRTVYGEKVQLPDGGYTYPVSYVPLAVTIITPCGSYAQQWAAENGYRCEVSAHNPVADPAVAATCTTEGLTEGSHCSTCNAVLVAQQPIPATGHTPVADPAVAATCTTEGKTEGSHCAVCSEVLIAQQPIPATGHTPVADPAVAPAYGVEGRTEGSHCAVCGAVLVAQQPIPALTYQELALSKVKNNGTITLSVGEQRLIVPAFATASGWTVTGYKSSKAKVASIDGNGLLTANAEGSAKITVTTAQKKSATVTVKVVDPYKPTAIAIAQGKAVTITMGQPLQLNATLAPESARATLTWTSSKGKVATVDGNGLVTPVGEGKTKITVKTQNKKKATITVQVVDPNKPLGIAIAQGKAVTMKVGETLQLGVGLNPATAQSALTWKTNKAAIATVDANGLVTAVKKGKAKITVTTYNKKKTTITVNVVP